MTETRMVQVICPDCRRQFDVPDGAAEAQCPQCGETLVWRSCLDTNEVFTVLQKWETWVHPGCETKHPVDLTHVLSAARPQGIDPSTAPVQRPAEGVEQTVYSPVQLAEDVEWADQDITGRLIVDSDRLAILPGAGVARPPLSVAWLRDVLDFGVQHAGTEGEDKKRKRFGRKKDGKDGALRPSVVVFAVPGGQISIASSDQPDVLLANLDQFLRPRLTPANPPVGGPVAPPAPQGPPQPSGPLAPGPLAPPQAPMPPPTAAQATAPLQTAPQAPAGVPAAPPGQHGADVGAAPPVAQDVDPAALPDLEPETPEGVYESIRKLAELAVLGTISSEEFKAKKAQLLARL
jgi:predicted RNA-binding Zn-ribbon protein involved in translation (DUF1610 family)